MKILSDEQLISKIREDNCSESVIELASRHRGLIVQMAKKYAKAAQCSGVRLEDFMDDANFIVFDAACAFDKGKNIKFVTWLGNKVRYHCLNTLNKQSKYYSPNSEEFTDFVADNAANEAEDIKHRMAEQMDYVRNILSQIKDKRVEHIINLRYFNGTDKKGSFSAIAKKLHMSIQGVIDLHDSFIAFVSEKMRASDNMDKI